MGEWSIERPQRKKKYEVQLMVGRNTRVGSKFHLLTKKKSKDLGIPYTTFTELLARDLETEWLNEKREKKDMWRFRI